MPGVKDWVKKASSDLRASKKLSDDGETFDCAVFHTHQCAEKSLKAFIVLSQRAIPKTHDFRFLLEHCAEIDAEFMLLREECKVLNSYGHDARYPNDFFYVDKACTEKSTTMVENILAVVKKKTKI